MSYSSFIIFSFILPNVLLTYFIWFDTIVFHFHIYLHSKCDEQCDKKLLQSPCGSEGFSRGTYVYYLQYQTSLSFFNLYPPLSLSQFLSPSLSRNHSSLISVRIFCSIGQPCKLENHLHLSLIIMILNCTISTIT